MDDDEEPPPLEPPRPGRAVDPPPPLEGEAARVVKPVAGAAGAAASGASNGTMGLKKGFLSAGREKPRAAAARKAAQVVPPAEMEVIRPSNPAPGGKSGVDARLAGLRIDEVQDALKGAGAKLAADTSWVTEDLLAQMQADPLLRQGLTNPRFQAVITELQTDPQGAMKRHAGDGELQMFIMRFMKLMAAHFSSLAPASGNAAAGVATRAAEPAAITPALSAADRAAEDLAKKALADPELRAVLEDADVQRVLQHVQSRNVAPVEQLMRRPEMMVKLQKLARAGLLQMSWAK